MAFTFRKNLLSSGIDGDIMYTFKEFMKSTSPNGPAWTVKSSSNGTTYGAGDNISAKGNLTVNGSWFVLRAPSGTRELMFQHTSGGNTYLIRYSAVSGFTGGSATVAPTATDQKIILSNSGGTSGQLFLGGSATKTIVTQFGADDSDNYSFFMASYNIDHTISSGCLYMDCMAPDSYSAINDLDPVVFNVSVTSTFSYSNICSTSTTNNVSRCTAWFNKGSVSEVFGTCPGNIYRGSQVSSYVPGYTPQDFNVKNTLLLPIPYIKLNYFKGIGKNFKWNPFGLSGTAYSQVSSGSMFYTKAVHNDTIIFGDVAFPWDGSNVL